MSVLSRLLAGLLPLLKRIDFTTPRASYIMRSVLAAWLALVVAYLLDLEMAYSAASTVLLVINPVQGAVIGKGTWRVLGTLVGMLAAIVLMSAFGQMPWLFLLGFGVWLGLCVAAMTVLRHFRGSGAVVAGYTVGLATYGAMGHAEHTFEHVIGRGSTVMIGVMCLGLVSALFSTRGIHGKLTALLQRLVRDTAGALALQQQTQGADPKSLVAARRSLLSEIYSVDDLLAVGKAESAELAQRASAIRHAMASLFAALLGGRPPLAADPASVKILQSVQPDLEQAWTRTQAAMGRGSAGIDEASQILLQARATLIAALSQAILGEPAKYAHVLIAGDRLVEQIDDYLAALNGLAALPLSSPPQSQAPVRFHRDFTAAWQNGLRAMLTLVLGGAFWIVTGWPHGDMMLLVLAPYCALLATAGNPPAAAVEFIKGTLVAVPMAWLCAFVALPLINGLPLLLIVLALFWLPGIYATSQPRYAFAGLAYLVGFNTLAAAANPMHYDLALFLNWSVAWIAATFFTLLGFRVILPRKLPHDIARLRWTIRDDALAILRGKRAQARVWQLRQQHRMAQLGALLKTQAEKMDRAIEEAWASVHLGREVLRLRQWLRRVPPTDPMALAIQTLLQRLARRAHDPALAARHVQRCVQQLARLSGLDAVRVLDQQRLLAALTDMAALLHSHAAYFSHLSRSSLDA